MLLTGTSGHLLREVPWKRNKGSQVGSLAFRLSAGGGRKARKSRDAARTVYISHVPAATPHDDANIRSALSAPRIGTYVQAARGDTVRAVELYGWNARVSAALMLPAHFAEVTTRNAVDEALTGVYGSRWPWNPTFVQSLPNPKGKGYNPRRNLQLVAGHEPTTGKVIAELKFVFWQTMFTARHDGRVWGPQIGALFPNATIGAKALRGRVYDDLDAIRQLRNRIAHHEPIFARDLSKDLARMLELVDLRSTATSRWVRAMEDATTTLTERP